MSADTREPPPSSPRWGDTTEYHPLSYHEIHLWALQMHVMLGAGMPLLGCLELIAMCDLPRLSTACDEVATRISQGHRMSDAMNAIKPSFSPFVANLVAVGEKSGRLVQVCERIAERSFRRDKTQRAVRGALAYPLFLGAVSGAMAFFMAFYMFPKLLPFLTALGVPLPWPTRALIWGAENLTAFLLAFTSLAGLVGFVLSSNSHPRVAMVRDWLVYSSPLFGKINRERVYADSLNDLYILLEAHCDLVAGLKALNPPWTAQRERILDCVKLIRAGTSFSRAVETSGMLPRRFSAPVSSAEETGQLSHTFRLMSEQLEESVIMDVDRLVQLLEPAIMATMGLITGFIVLATFLPLYSMASNGL